MTLRLSQLEEHRRESAQCVSGHEARTMFRRQLSLMAEETEGRKQLFQSGRPATGQVLRVQTRRKKVREQYSSLGCSRPHW